MAAGMGMDMSARGRQRAHDVLAQAERWHEMLDIGAELATPLTSALERVQQLAKTGRIDRVSLRALAAEVGAARRAAMVVQQLARLSAGQVRQSRERLDLACVLRQTSASHRLHAESRGTAWRSILEPAEVVADPSLLFALLDALLDWAVGHAASAVELRLDTGGASARAHLRCRLGQGTAVPGPLAWRLVDRLALTMGVTVERRSDDRGTTVALTFDADDRLPGASVVELDGVGSAVGLRALAGSHVLVVAARRDVRASVRDAVRHLGLVVDFVGSVSEAGDFCRGGLPHAVVYESALDGENFEALRQQWQTHASLAFIELAEDGSGFEMSGFDGARPSLVGRDAIATALPSALAFELARHQ